MVKEDDCFRDLATAITDRSSLTSINLNGNFITDHDMCMLAQKTFWLGPINTFGPFEFTQQGFSICQLPNIQSFANCQWQKGQRPRTSRSKQDQWCLMAWDNC